jgi:precorrin-2 dehydrogenase/sirohydrochlorin ferrochelatase
MMLDVTGRLVVVVGGGAVAARKVKGLIAAGARQIRVIAPTFHPELPANVERLPTCFRPDHLDGAGLVFAATDDPAANDAVLGECRRRGVLVCRADASEESAGDFATPAIHQQGALTVTVSTAGSPALATALRDAIAERLDPRWAQMADMMSRLRPAILAAERLDIATRRRIFRDLATPAALDALGGGGLVGLRRWLIERWPQLDQVLSRLADDPVPRDRASPEPTTHRSESL